MAYQQHMNQMPHLLSQDYFRVTSDKRYFAAFFWRS